MSRILFIGVLVLSAPLALQADAIITGVLNFTGTAQVSEGAVDFVGNTFNINSPASSQQGGFMALAGTTGTIQNLVNPPDAVGPLNVPDFITFAADPTISITLTYLLPGIDSPADCFIPAAAGEVCTPNVPAESPFNLQDTSATSSSASVVFWGTEVDSSTGDTASVVGTFTQPFSSQSYQDLLTTVFAGGTVTTAFSGQLTVTAIPEPSAFMLFAPAFCLFLGISLVRRNRRTA